jgi:hypothetical protein
MPPRLSFFMTGRDITVRNLTFDHAADQDHNSAGILAHGENRTVERSSFIVNENDLPTLTAFTGNRSATPAVYRATGCTAMFNRRWVRVPSVLDGCDGAAGDRNQPGQLWLGTQERLNLIRCLLPAGDLRQARIALCPYHDEHWCPL